MSKSTADLVRIAAAGGGMTLSSGKSTADLVRIAAAGQGCVTFDLSA
ncbi:hypothetical protein [Rheinheimera hassiensis]|nr:hypothetical protein [Rheinheimera hassiensis]